MKRLLFLVFLLAASGAQAAPTAFLAHPREEGWFNVPSVDQRDGPYAHHPATQLIVADNEGETVLVDCKVQDFSVSLDGKSLLVSIVDDPKINGGRADIWRVNLETKQRTRITDNASWNCQAWETADGVVFLSTRDGWRSPRDRYPAFTIYRADRDGKNPKRIWHAGLGGVFGLFVGPDGWVYFSSGESQGLHGGGGVNWAIWRIRPDGSGFDPMVSTSGIKMDSAFDFPIITSDGSLVISVYYDIRDLGSLWAIPKFEASPFGPPTRFGNPLFTKNKSFKAGGGAHTAVLCYQPHGIYSLTHEATIKDIPSIGTDGKPTGIYGYPAPYLNNGVMCTWTANQPRNETSADLGIYLIPDVKKPVTHYELIPVVDRPDRNEWLGKPVVPFAEIFGHDPPGTVADKAEDLPVGSPFGVVQSSSVDINEWPNDSESPKRNHALWTMALDEAAHICVVAMSPTMMNPKQNGLKHSFNAPGGGNANNYEGFASTFNERAGYYDLIPLRKYRNQDGSAHVGPNPPEGATRILRSDGMPDTSFSAEIPANQPWTFMLLNDEGEAIKGSWARTWHQVIPGEIRNCAGCHAHWMPDRVPFEETFAATAEWIRPRLDKVQTVVYDRDIAPLGLNIPKKPWVKGHEPQYKFTDTALLNLVRPEFTDEQARLVRMWQNLGFLAAGEFANGRLIQPSDKLGPYLDTMPPTLVVERLSDRTVVGAMDPWSGLESLVIKYNNADVTDQFSLDEAEHTWTGPVFMDGHLVVVAKDNDGNESTFDEYAEVGEPDNSDEIARVQALLEAAIAEVSRLQQLLASLTGT